MRHLRLRSSVSSRTVNPESIQNSINEFNQVISTLAETSYQPEDSKLTTLTKWSFAKVGQMSFEDHDHDAAHFIKSYHSSLVSTSKFMSSVSHCYWICVSESESFSLTNWQVVRNPRVSSDQAPEQQQYHDLAWLNSLSDALSHCLYLRVAHGHLFNAVGDSASGLEGSIIKAGRQAPIIDLTVSSPESGFSKFKMI